MKKSETKYDILIQRYGREMSDERLEGFELDLAAYKRAIMEEEASRAKEILKD